uniref:Uncharacterized protein n=1 Tax=Rhizophagus irregularis (strain DAOM 181602 / DAOM 197198 / MUCL 43194) TaxID=747089 RepID=U9SNG4_RHIID
MYSGKKNSEKKELKVIDRFKKKKRKNSDWFEKKNKFPIKISLTGIGLDIQHGLADQATLN